MLPSQQAVNAWKSINDHRTAPNQVSNTGQEYELACLSHKVQFHNFLSKLFDGPRNLERVTYLQHLE